MTVSGINDLIKQTSAHYMGPRGPRDLSRAESGAVCVDCAESGASIARGGSTRSCEDGRSAARRRSQSSAEIQRQRLSCRVDIPVDVILVSVEQSGSS